MQRYQNLSLESGVESYEIGHGSIIVKFVSGWIYEYTDATTGKENILQMQKLAISGRGLNTFINQNVKLGYKSKWQA